MSEAGLKAMYEAQTTWDETMAESAARALAQAGPDARMMIMAGAFHIQERDPIPARLLRRIGDARSTIVVGRSQSAAPESPAEAAELGDFVVVLPDKQEVPAVKLGVVFDETRHWAGLRVKAVVTGGTASKAGIDILTRCMAAELGPKGLRFATIAPGYIRTPGVAALEASGRVDFKSVRRRIPMGDLGRPDDIADAAFFLASSDASYVNGSILYVDGGWTSFGNAGFASDSADDESAEVAE